MEPAGLKLVLRFFCFEELDSVHKLIRKRFSREWLGKMRIKYATEAIAEFTLSLILKRG